MPTGKRTNPIHDTPPKDIEKLVKENEESLCLVCGSVIVEGGEDVIGKMPSTVKVTAKHGFIANVLA